MLAKEVLVLEMGRSKAQSSTFPGGPVISTEVTPRYLVGERERVNALDGGGDKSGAAVEILIKRG